MNTDEKIIDEIRKDKYWNTIWSALNYCKYDANEIVLKAIQKTREEMIKDELIFLESCTTVKNDYIFEHLLKRFNKLKENEEKK